MSAHHVTTYYVTLPTCKLKAAQARECIIGKYLYIYREAYNVGLIVGCNKQQLLFYYILQ